MHPHGPVRPLAVLLSITVLGCSDPTAPGIYRPPDPPTTMMYLGEWLATSVDHATEGLPRWVWLNEREVAYSRRFPANPSGVTVVDVETRQYRHVLMLDRVQMIAFAKVEGLLYASDLRGLHAVDPAGSESRRLSDEVESFFAVSPNGRYRLESVVRPEVGTAPPRLIDATTGDTLRPPSVDRLDYLTDDGQMVFVHADRVGVMDIATGTTTASWDFEANGGRPVDLRGPVDRPEVTLLQPSGGAVTLEVDGTGSSGFTPLHTIQAPTPIHGDPLHRVRLDRCADGRRYLFVVPRHLIWGSALTVLAWEIEVYDVDTGERRVVAGGLSRFGPSGLTCSPDGTRMIYEDNRTLYLVELG